MFFATSGHSGVDRVMTNLIRTFAARGIGVDVLHVRNHGPYLDPVPSNVRIVEMGTAHVNSSLFPLIRYLRREQPAALLTDKDRVNRLALWARRLARVPTRVIVRTGTTVSRDLASRRPLQRWLQRISMRRFYRWADGIIVPSAGAARDLAQVSGLPLHRIRAVPSPVITPELRRLAEEPAAHPWFTTKDRPIVLGVGELCGRKDFATLIRAFAKLRQERACRLVILGEGRQRARLAALARDLGIGDDVAMPGFVKNPYPYMSRADLFVLSSNLEGAPVVLMEALAIGTPAVSTDCPSGPREILGDGRYGPLVPVGDSEALSKAMLATLDNPPDRALLKQGAEPFLAETSATSYLQVLGLLG